MLDASALPILLGASAIGRTSIRSPAVAPLASLLVVLALYMIDGLFNAMANPIFMLIAGCATTVAMRRKGSRA